MPDDGAPADPLEGGDTHETRIHELGDGDVEAVKPDEPSDQVVSVPAEITKPTARRCSECGRPVLSMGVCEPLRLEDLMLGIYWTTCSVSGHPDLPAWWFCSRANPEGTEGWFAVTGAFRVLVQRPEHLK